MPPTFPEDTPAISDLVGKINRKLNSYMDFRLFVFRWKEPCQSLCQRGMVLLCYLKFKT